MNKKVTMQDVADAAGVSKSTVWKDQARLRSRDPGLWGEVRQVMLKNKAERHLRGGAATRRKYSRK